MKITKIFKKKKKEENRSSVESQVGSLTGSSELGHRGSSEISMIGSTPRSPPVEAKRSVSAKTEESNGSPRHSNGAEEPPSPGVQDETQNSEADDLVSDMITPLASSKRKIKGVSESFKGLGVSHRFNVPQIEKSASAVRELSERYDAIPEMEQTRLPRGGISIDTKAVGRVQVCTPDSQIALLLLHPNQINFATSVWDSS